MLTLNQIVSQITNLAAAHNQIAESGVGDFAEWQAKERSYPILWVFHESTSVNQMEISFSIRLICADRVIVGEEGDNTEGHEQEVLSDTLLVLLDFLAYFQQNHSQPYNVVTSATIDPFTERLNDRLAGNSVTIQIRQPFDWNKCQIPQSGASIPPSVDGLTLYNFCDPAVIDRLTSAQVACLQSEYALPADITINSAPFGTAPSGGTFDVVVVNGGSNPVGSEQSGEWVIGNSTVTINGTQVGDIVAEDTLPIAVELDGNPSGTWNAGTQTWDVTSAPCPPATFSIDGVQVDTIASGADLDVSVELNGSPVTPTYNSGTKVIGVTGGVSGSISVAVSDATPNFGDTITITATPTGLTPTSYLFFAFDGSTAIHIPTALPSDNVATWVVSFVGTFKIYALATDGILEAYNTESVTATSTLILDSIGVMADYAIALRRLTINYTGPACVVMRSSDSDTLPIPYIGEHLDTATLISFVGIGNGFSATLFDQVGSNNAIQSTAAAIPSIVISGTVQTINGRPAIAFDGTTDQMVLASNVVFAHAFAVARKTANVNGAQMLFGATGGVGISVGGTFSTYNNISIITTGGVVSSTIDNTVAHQISFRLGTGGTAQIMVDGVIAKTGTTSATLSCSHVGTDPQFNSRHVGSLAELFTFSTPLSDANRNILNANQKAYYGTP